MKNKEIYVANLMIGPTIEVCFLLGINILGVFILNGLIKMFGLKISDQMVWVVN